MAFEAVALGAQVPAGITEEKLHSPDVTLVWFHYQHPARSHF